MKDFLILWFLSRCRQTRFMVDSCDRNCLMVLSRFCTAIFLQLFEAFKLNKSTYSHPLKISASIMESWLDASFNVKNTLSNLEHNPIYANSQRLFEKLKLLHRNLYLIPFYAKLFCAQDFGKEITLRYIH